MHMPGKREGREDSNVLYDVYGISSSVAIGGGLA